MMDETHQALVCTIVTHKSRSKRRYARVDDPILIKALKSGAKLVNSTPRASAGFASGRLVGIFALATNNIMEHYLTADTEEVAFVFSNIDVWLTFTSDDIERD